METVLVGLAALACPVGMGLMMWFMARGRRHGRSGGETPQPSDVEALRAEHRRLGEEIGRLEGERPRAPDEGARLDRSGGGSA
jgi:hypothetical protein